MSSWHRVEDGGDNGNTRRKAYAKEYEFFTESENPFDHLKQKLLPTHSDTAEKKQ